MCKLCRSQNFFLFSFLSFALFPPGLIYEHAEPQLITLVEPTHWRHHYILLSRPRGSTPHLTEHGRSNDAAWEWESGPHLQNVDFDKAT